MDADEHVKSADATARPPPVSLLPGVGAAASDAADRPLPHIDGYDVLGYLGAGASGSVWRARQQSTGRQVALKLMGGAIFGTEKAQVRFEREVELAARLNHANIARLYDSGIRHGYYFYAMELIEGVPLDQFTRARSLTQNQIIALMRQVCHAVQHAHTCGVIHRDLKPSNILVTADGEPHVLDFGLAKAINAEPAQPHMTVTMDGEAAGTVAYMSPEQAAGKLDEVGTTSDVYSLGVILFELLTGKYPHEPAGPIYEQLTRIVHDEPRRPRAINPSIDKDLQAVMLKALAMEPKARYTNAAELARDMANYQAGDAVQARPLTLAYFIGKLIRKHRARVAAVSAVTALIVGTLVFTYVRVTHERDIARQQTAATEQALYFNRITLAAAELEKHHVDRVKEQLSQCPAALRNWEWHYLKAVSEQSVRTFTTGEGRIRPLSINAAGDLIFAKDGKRICTMRLSDGKILKSRDLPHRRVVFSDDGAWAMVAAGNTLRWMDPQTLEDRGVPVELSREIETLAISDDGWAALELASGGLTVMRPDGSTVRDWRDSNRHALARWLAGHRIAELSGQSLRILNCADGRVESQVNLPAQSQCVIASAGRDEIWSAGMDGILRRIDAGQARIVHTIDTNPHPSVIMAVDSSDPWIIAGDINGAISVRDMQSGELLMQLFGHDSSVTGLFFDAKDGRLISGDHLGAIKVWQLKPEHPIKRTIRLPDIISSVAACPTRNIYAAGLVNGQILIQDADGRTQQSFATDCGMIQSLAWDPAGKLLAVTGDNGCVIWDAMSQTVAHRLAMPEGKPHRAAFSPDGCWLAVAMVNKVSRLVIWDGRTWQPVTQLAASAPLAWSADSSMLCAVTDSGELQSFVAGSWRAAEPLPPMSEQQRPVIIAALGGKQMLVETFQGELLRWNTGRMNLTTLGVPFSSAVVLSCSGNFQRALGAGNAIKIIDTVTGVQVFSLPMKASDMVWNVQLLADQRHLVAAGSQQIDIWNASNAGDPVGINRH